MRTRLRFLAILVFAAVLLLIYLTLGRGTVIIDSGGTPSTISLTGLGDSKVIAKGHNNLKVRLGNGEYVASVTGNNSASKQYIKVSGHKTLHYSIRLKATRTPVPTLSAGAKNMSAGPTLLYLGGSDNLLYSLDAQNNLSQVGSNQTLRDVQWIGGGKGVGQDNGGQLYSVSQAGITRIALPVSYVNYYSVAPNGTIYASRGQTVYVGSISGSFKKLYKSGSAFTSLAAFNGGVAVIASPVADSPSAKVFVSIVNSSGKALTKSLSMAGSTVWSPDGKYLTGLAGSNYELFDQSLKVAAVVPNGYVSDPAWLSNTSMMFVSGSQVWQYDVSAQRSDLIANVPSINSISQIAVNEDLSAAYLSVTNINNSLSVVKINLKGPDASAIFSQLQDILPLNLDNYSIDMVNYGQPVIVVQPFPGTDPQDDLQAAKNTLQSYGFDISQLQFKLMPAGT